MGWNGNERKTDKKGAKERKRNEDGRQSEENKRIRSVIGRQRNEKGKYNERK